MLTRLIDFSLKNKFFVLAATVALAEHLGDSSILHLRVDRVDELIHAKVGAEYNQIEAGQGVGLVVDASRALALDAAGRLLP